MMRTLLAVAALLAASVLTDTTAMADREDDDDEAYAIGLWGDLPYSDIQATTDIPNLIADMNAHRLKFTVHDGDLKAGNSIPPVR